jgi:WD40 repeat protein
VALVAAALVLGIAASVWQAVRATAAEGLAQDRKNAADQAKEEAEKRRDALAALNASLRRARYVADMSLAHHAWAENNLIRTRQLLELHRPQPGELDQRDFEWHYLHRLFYGALWTVQAHNARTATAAFTPDGKGLISCGKSQSPKAMNVWKDVPGEIKLWDVTSGRPLPLGLKGPTGILWQVALSPDGTRLAAACDSQGIRIWDLATGQQNTLERQAKELVIQVRFSPDGKRLVSKSKPEEDNSPIFDRTVRVWDLAARKVLVTFDKLAFAWSALEFSPDGKFLAFADYLHSAVRVFDAATARETFSCTYADGFVTHAVFSPDGKRLAACGERGIQVWDVATRAAVATWPTASILGTCLAFSPDGRRLALGSIEGVLELRDADAGQKVGTFHGHAGEIRMIAFSPDGTRLASAGMDGTLRLWDTTGRREAVPFAQGEANIGLTELSPDGQTVFTLSIDGTRLRLWDAATGEPRGDPIPVGTSSAPSFDWTADGKRLFLAGPAKDILVCDVAAGKVVRTFPVEVEGQGVLAVSPDGKWFAHPAAGGAVKVRDAQTGAEVRTLNGLDDRPHYLVFSPDGARLLGTDKSGALKMWELASGRVTAAARLKNIYVWRIRFSPDGRRLVIVGNRSQFLSGEVRILDAASGRELLALKGHTVSVDDAAFSPDGQRLATSSTDRTVRLWDLTTGQEVLTLRGHTRMVHSIRFLSEGSRLVSASADRTVRVWDATPLPEEVAK